MKVSGSNILVTGGTGMIGQAIVRHLQDAGASVTTLSRRGARPGNPEHEALRGSITDAASLDFDGFDAVVHGAAFVGFGLSKAKNEIMRKTNVAGTQNVLDAAARAGCKKVVHVSSVAALGTGWGKTVDESWYHERPETFQSVYEETKFHAHRLILDESRMQTAAVMPSVVLGLGNSSSGLLLTRFLQRRIPVAPRHPGKIAFVHVEDVAAGTVAALHKGDAAYVLSEESMSLHELFPLLAELTGVRAPRVSLPYGVMKAASFATFGLAPNKDFVRNMGTSSLFDSSLARKKLGWRPDLRAHLRNDGQTFGAQR